LRTPIGAPEITIGLAVAAVSLGSTSAAALVVTTTDSRYEVITDPASKSWTRRKYVPPAVSVLPAIVDACCVMTVPPQSVPRPSSSSNSSCVVPSGPNRVRVVSREDVEALGSTNAHSRAPGVAVKE
jgi:hypothetical protein